MAPTAGPMSVNAVLRETDAVLHGEVAGARRPRRRRGCRGRSGCAGSCRARAGSPGRARPRGSRRAASRRAAAGWSPASSWKTFAARSRVGERDGADADPAEGESDHRVHGEHVSGRPVRVGVTGSTHGPVRRDALDPGRPGVHRRPAARRDAAPDPRQRPVRAERRQPAGHARDRGARPRRPGSGSRSSTSPPYAATSRRSRPARARGTASSRRPPTAEEIAGDRRARGVHEAGPDGRCGARRLRRPRRRRVHRPAPRPDRRDQRRLGLPAGLEHPARRARNEGFGGTITTMAVAEEPAVRGAARHPGSVRASRRCVPIGKPVKVLTKLRRNAVEEFVTRERFDGEPF